MTGKVSPEDQRLVRELVLGVSSRRLFLEKVVQHYLHGPAGKTKLDARILLMTGAYQILFMPWIPPHAAVNETVKVAKSRKKMTYSAAMINAVLRKIAEESDTWLDVDAMDYDDKACYLGFPNWLARMWQAQYGEDMALDTMDAMTNQRGVGIRVNLNRSSLDHVKAQLTRQGYSVSDLTYSRSGLYVEQARELSELDLYKKGAFSIQDESAILVGDLLLPLEGKKVLDLCAAPGGKSFHLASACLSCKVTLNDIYPHKVARLETEARRLGLKNCFFSVHDAASSKPEWDGAFDICLVDAPCSALGLIGRKPEIKSLRRPEDLDAIIVIQRRILSQAVRYVKPGGLLVYSTCTLNKKENEKQMEWLFRQHPFSPVTLGAPLPKERIEREAATGMITLTTKDDATNGFFIAITRKDGP